MGYTPFVTRPNYRRGKPQPWLWQNPGASDGREAGGPANRHEPQGLAPPDILREGHDLGESIAMDLVRYVKEYHLNYLRPPLNYLRPPLHYLGRPLNYLGRPLNYLRPPLNYVRPPLN